ncbi:MAG TPA: hypothetical protein VGB46_05640 [Flavisolibacter sp.]|jgi:chromosome segregation ATPase
MTVDQQFNALNEKLQLLLKQYQRLQKDNERLREELNLCRQKELGSQQKLEAMEQQISILKLASGEMNDQDKRELEKKINHYIKEIDRCISFLSQ